MAFRLHHYEALIRDKESLQMPCVLECAALRLYVCSRTRGPFPTLTCLSLALPKWRKNAERRKEGKTRSYFAIASRLKIECSSISVASRRAKNEVERGEREREGTSLTIAE